MILHINTTEKIAELKLYNDKIKLLDDLSFDSSFILSEELIQKIDLLITKNGFSKKDLTALVVNSGPGSYTGVRIGVTTGNFIAFALNIPIIEITNNCVVEKGIKKRMTKKNFSSPVLPFYNNLPHITRKR